MKKIIITCVLLIGFIGRAQEVRVKFYNYSPTAYLIYNHSNGGYDIESAGALVKVTKLGELEYQGESWLHFQLHNPLEKIKMTDFIRYSFMWNTLDETKKNMNLYWGYVNNTSKRSATTFMDYVAEQSVDKYNNLGVGMRFTFRIGTDFIVKKSSIPKVDSEDKKALVSHAEIIRGIGIVRLYDIQYYEGFDMEFNKVFNLEGHHNQVAYNDINNKIRLNANNPEVHKYFKELKRMYSDYPVVAYMTDQREIDLGVFRELGYVVDLGVLCGVSQDAEAQKYLESMQKGVKNNLGYGTYSERDLHMLEVLANRSYDDFLMMIER